MTNNERYIATQGIHDEIRFLADLYTCMNNHGNNVPIALSGPPANGKSEAIQFFAEQVAQMTEGESFLFQIASQMDTKYDFSGMPLIINGNSTFSETQLLQIMNRSSGGIWFLDEVDQLPREVQKDIVSVLDDRRKLPVIREVDGKPTVTYLNVANPGAFGALFAYNPDPRVSITRKFHPAFTSRFIERQFGRLPNQLMNYLVKKRAGREAEIALETRGILFSDEGPLFLEKKEGEWYHNGETYKGQTDKVLSYSWFDDGKPLLPVLANDKTRRELSMDEFVDCMIEQYLPYVEATSRGESHDGDAGKRTNNQFTMLEPDIRMLSPIVAAGYRNVALGNYSEQDAQAIMLQTLIDNVLKGDLSAQRLNGYTAKDYLFELADLFIYKTNGGDIDLEKE